MNVFVLSSSLLWAFTVYAVDAFAFSSSSPTSTSSSSSLSSSSAAAFYHRQPDTKHTKKTLFTSTACTRTSTSLSSSTASSEQDGKVHDNDVNHNNNNTNHKTTNNNRLFLRKLLGRLQGDFDNYSQVLQDRERGLTPRESGSHEQFHCTFLPISPSVLPSDVVVVHDVEPLDDSIDEDDDDGGGREEEEGGYDNYGGNVSRDLPLPCTLLPAAASGSMEHPRTSKISLGNITCKYNLTALISFRACELKCGRTMSMMLRSDSFNGCGTHALLPITFIPCA